MYKVNITVLEDIAKLLDNVIMLGENDVTGDDYFEAKRLRKLIKDNYYV